MDAATRRTVRARANDRCEYCLLPQIASPLAPLEIEHIVPRKHRGTDELENLAIACYHCNSHKGANLAGLDPASNAMTELFHPRRHLWAEHFQMRGPIIAGLTAIGRTTVEVLCMNAPEMVRLRGTLSELQP